VKLRINFIIFLGLLSMARAGTTRAQQPTDSATPPAHQGRQENVWIGQERGPRPIVGQITALHEGTIEITTPDGQALTVKWNDQTEFRKDREKAKASDFKAGDLIMVRGHEAANHVINARMIGARTGGPGMEPLGTLGKDYVAGEVKVVDAPRLTVLRPDNVTQTIDLNEETSLRRVRESITMAEIQVGDHVIARGAQLNEVFVPKSVMVMGAEQWQRMQERGRIGKGPGAAGPQGAPPKPQEQPN
jgi:hypothetical protein